MTTRLPLLLVAMTALIATATAQTCTPERIPTFDPQPGLLGRATHALVADLGQGASLYVAGDFDSVAGVPVSNFARFNGTDWSSGGGAIQQPNNLTSIVEFDDGSGSKLFAASNGPLGASLPGPLSVFDGASWSAAPGLTSGGMGGLAVHDDGTGAALYALGSVVLASGAPIDGIARFDGTSWSNALGGSLVHSNSSRSLTVIRTLDDGSGPALFVGCTEAIYQTPTGPTTLQGIIKIQGGVPSQPYPATGIDPLDRITDITFIDLGFGIEPYLLAVMPQTSAFNRHRILGGGAFGWGQVLGPVLGELSGLVVFDDGTGPKLLTACDDRTGAFPALVFNGLNWNPLSLDPLDTDGAADVLTVGDIGSGPSLFVGGRFTSVGASYARGVAAYQNGEWSSLAQDHDSVSGATYALKMFDDGSGKALYAGGSFTSAGPIRVDGLARFTNGNWEGMPGGGLTLPPSGNRVAHIRAFKIFDDGNGPMLYAGGTFETIGGVAAAHIARWDGTSWSSLGIGLSNGTGTAPTVYDMEVFDDGTGDALYISGDFQRAGGGNVNGITRWDGSSFSPLGLGTGGFDGLTSTVAAMEVYDDGNGPRLYASGTFIRMDGLPDTKGIAVWDGSNWGHLVTGVSLNGSIPDVTSLKTFDDGSGSKLWVAGVCPFPDGIVNRKLLTWDGQSFVDEAFGVSAGIYPYAFDVIDGINGKELYMFGNVGFFSPNIPRGPLAVETSAGWVDVLGAMGGDIFAVESGDLGDGFGPTIFFGGSFDTGLGEPTYLGRFGGCTPGIVGEGYCDSTPNSTGQTSTTQAVGSSLVSSNALELVAELLPTGTFGIFATSRTPDSIPAPIGAQGTLCLGGSIGRFVGPGQVLNSGAAGTFSLPLDLGALPQGLGTIAALAGETWHFQAWFRDANPSATSNFSSGVRVLMR